MVVDKLRTLTENVRGSPQYFAFVFTGQCAQWPEMGKEPFAELPVFRDAVAEMEASLAPPPWSLKELMLDPKATSRIMEPAYSEPTCTAIQVGLVKLLNSWVSVPQPCWVILPAG